MRPPDRVGCLEKWILPRTLLGLRGAQSLSEDVVRVGFLLARALGTGRSRCDLLGPRRRLFQVKGLSGSAMARPESRL